jgi:hypothetical protein
VSPSFCSLGVENHVAQTDAASIGQRLPAHGRPTARYGVDDDDALLVVLVVSLFSVTLNVTFTPDLL